LVEIRGKIERKIKVYGQLVVKLKKFAAKNLFEKSVEVWGQNWMKSGVKLKRIESLMVNLHKSKTNDQNEKGVEIQG